MKKHALLFTFLLFFAISCKYFGDPITRLKVTVKDKQGNSLENTSVSSFEMQNNVVRKVDLDKITKSDGVYETMFIGIVPQTSWLVFEKEGFITLKKDLILESEKVNFLDVVMEKE